MTKKGMTLEELSKALNERGLKGIHSTLPPLNPEVKELLQNYSEQFEEALQKGQEYRAKPLWNLSGHCPKCNGREYFDLFGGRCKKRCANCGTDYDCISMEDWLNLKSM